MKNLFYWRDIIGDKELFTPYTKEIAQLMRGEYKSLSLEKLHSSGTAPIYSIRVNLEERLLFTTYNRKLCLLDVVKNHDYHKSRFLRNPRVLRAFLGKLDLDDNNAPDDNDTAKDPVELKPLAGTFESTDSIDGVVFDDNNEPIKMQGLTQYRDCLIYFNDEQEHALSIKSPAVIYGPAGSGKTCVALSMLEQHVRNEYLSDDNTPIPPAIYVSRSEHLVADMKAAWDSVVTNQEHRQRVIFLTLDELFNQQEGSYKTSTDFKHFDQWYQGRRKIAPLKKISPYDLWQEFRILSGYETLEEYLELGKKQSCSFAAVEERPAVREAIADLYKSYTKLLLEEKIISPELNPPPAQTPYSLVLVDEAQDCSYGQLRALEEYSIQNHVVFFLGDHQILFDGKSRLPFLRNHFYQKQLTLSEQNLPRTYRCPPVVVEVANQLIKLKYHLVGGASDKVEASSIELPESTEQEQGQLHWCSSSVKDITPLVEQANSASVAVITHATYMEEARRTLQTPLIFTPEQIKGLEYDQIIVWKPFNTEQGKQANELLRATPLVEHVSSHRPKSGQGDETLLPYFNELITATTRARKQLFFVQDNMHTAQALIDCLKPCFSHAASIATPAASADKSLSQWDKEAKRLWATGNLDQARDIALSKLNITNDKLDAFFNPHKVQPTQNGSKQNKKQTPAEQKKQNKRRKNSVKNEKETRKPASITEVQMTTLLDNFLRSKGNVTSLLKLINKDTETSKVLLNCLANNLKFLMELPLVDLTNQPDIRISEVLEKGLNVLLSFIREINSIENYDVKEAIIKENSPSMVATELRLLTTLKDLSRLGANLHHTNQSGWTVAHFAARNGDKVILAFLKDQNIDLTQVDKKGYTPASIASCYGANDGLVALKKLGIDLNNSKSYEVSPGYAAALNDHRNTLLLLDDLGVDINQKTTYGLTPLFAAASQGYCAFLNTLKKLGADFNLRDQKGFTAACAATCYGRNETLKTLNELGADLHIELPLGITLAHLAVQFRQNDTLRVLHGLGVNLNQANIEGRTPAHAAAEKDYCDTLQILHELGADVNKQDQNGQTPASLATKAGNDQVLEILHDLGVNLNQVDKDGNSLAHIATRFGYTSMLITLKKLGVDFNWVNQNGETLAHVAVEFKRIEVLKLLKEQGIDLDRKNKIGETPACYAADVSDCAALETLAQLGANLSLSSKEGATPTFLAAEYGNLEAFIYLIKTAPESLQSSLNTDKDKLMALVALVEGPQKNIQRIEERVKTIIKERSNDGETGDKISISPKDIAWIMGHHEILDYIDTYEKDQKMLASLEYFLSSQNESSFLFDYINKDQETSKAFLRCIANNNLKYLLNLPLSNFKSKRNCTPPLKKGLQELVKVLDSFGFKKRSLSEKTLIEKLIKDGVKPIILLAKNGEHNLIKKLCDLGADVNATYKDGYTAAHVAVQSEQCIVLKILKKLGANLDQASTFGITAAYQAAELDNAQSLITLKELGADLNKADINGYSPVFAAVMSQQIKALNTLKLLGANLNQRNTDGFTAVHIATHSRDREMTRALIKLKADPNLRNNVGASPAFIALKFNYYDILNILIEAGVDLDQSVTNDASNAFITAQSNSLECLKIVVDKNPNSLNIPFITEIKAFRDLANSTIGSGKKGIKERIEAKIKERLEQGDTENKILLLPKDIAWVMENEECYAYIVDYERSATVPSKKTDEKVEVTSPRILADKNSNLKANSTKQIVASGTNSPVFFTGKKKQASSSGSPDQNLLGSNEIKDSKNSPY